MGINEKAWHVGFKWTIGNEDVPAGALCVDNTSKQLHICDIADSNKDWDVGVVLDPTVYIHCYDTTAASSYIKMWHDDTDANIDCYGAAALNLGLAGTNYIEMSTSALYPTATNTMALGTASLNFTDIYLDSGGVLYCDGSNAILTMTSSALTVTPATTFSAAVTMDSTLTAGSHISVPQGSFIYFGGQASSEFIFSPATGKVQIGASGSDYDDIYLDGSVRVADDIRLNTTAKVEFRGTTEYVYSPSANRLDIVAGQYIYISPGDAYGLFLDCNYIYIGTAAETNKQLHFGQAGYIRAGSATCLDFVASGTGQYAIQFATGSGGSFKCDAYLGLKVTDNDGDSEGELWYDNSENVPKFYNGSAVSTLLDTVGAQIITGTKTLSTTTPLNFRTSNIYINSAAVNKLDLHSDGDVEVHTGSSIGHLGVFGFVFLSPTTAVGDTEGQFWYDGTTNKLHFWDGTGEREVQSA